MSLGELALLQVLIDVDQVTQPTLHTQALNARLIESGLADRSEIGLQLTDAGIERCKSLHRGVRAVAEAAALLKVLEQLNEGASPE